jgi:hypothetical protein
MYGLLAWLIYILIQLLHITVILNDELLPWLVGTFVFHKTSISYPNFKSWNLLTGK